MNNSATVHNFQDLLSLVDADCMSSGKERLYYKVEIDGRKNSNVLVRSVRRRNNTYAASFLIKSTHANGQYSIIYFSQIDLIEVISLLNEELSDLLWSHLTNIYLGKLNTSHKSIRFMREPINSELGVTLLTLNGSAVIIPLPEEDYMINTRFGFDISYQDFCDCLSLMLSMEPEQKIKTVLSKYFTLSELIASRKPPVEPPTELAHARNANDLRAAYDNISLKIEERETYDINNFTDAKYSRCFQKSS